MLATEAIMRSLARRFGENEDEWGLAGLLHDIDLELIGDDMTAHSKRSAEMAKQLGASDAVCHAILCHNEAHGEPFQTLMDKALFCADPLTGLITAAALVRPEKKLALSKLNQSESVSRKRVLPPAPIGNRLPDAARWDWSWMISLPSDWRQ